jgi:thiosulfate dehydrogenase [quinone] large subunit
MQTARRRSLEGGGKEMGDFISGSWEEKTRLSYVVIPRVFVGLFFLNAGLTKLREGFLSQPEILRGILTEWSRGIQIGWYKALTISIFIPNAGLFTALVVIGEILVGITLLIGFLTRLSSAVGIFMNMNYLLLAGWQGAAAAGINEAFIASEILFILSCAGRSFGVDRLLHERYPGIPFG